MFSTIYFLFLIVYNAFLLVYTYRMIPVDAQFSKSSQMDKSVGHIPIVDEIARPAAPQPAATPNPPEAASAPPQPGVFTPKNPVFESLERFPDRVFGGPRGTVQRYTVMGTATDGTSRPLGSSNAP